MDRLSLGGAGVTPDAPQRLGAVSLDLAWRHRPRLADETGAQASGLHLITQGRRRQPEKGCRLSEGEHLAEGGADCRRGQDGASAGEDGVGAIAPPAVRASERGGHVADRLVFPDESGLLAVWAGVAHLVSFVRCASNLARIRYVVNTLRRYYA